MSPLFLSEILRMETPGQVQAGRETQRRLEACAAKPNTAAVSPGSRTMVGRGERRCLNGQQGVVGSGGGAGQRRAPLQRQQQHTESTATHAQQMQARPIEDAHSYSSSYLIESPCVQANKHGDSIRSPEERRQLASALPPETQATRLEAEERTTREAVRAGQAAAAAAQQHSVSSADRGSRTSQAAVRAHSVAGLGDQLQDLGAGRGLTTGLEAEDRATGALKAEILADMEQKLERHLRFSEASATQVFKIWSHRHARCSCWQAVLTDLHLCGAWLGCAHTWSLAWTQCSCIKRGSSACESWPSWWRPPPPCGLCSR
eukprot:COSAG01_NODE_1117_length_11634_cov_26.813611_13_plen_317_part_00